MCSLAPKPTRVWSMYIFMLDRHVVTMSWSYCRCRIKQVCIIIIWITCFLGSKACIKRQHKINDITSDVKKLNIDFHSLYCNTTDKPHVLYNIVIYNYNYQDMFLNFKYSKTCYFNGVLKISKRKCVKISKRANVPSW